MNESASYRNIMQQNGMEECKELIRKWEILSRNLRNLPARTPNLLPDLFLVSRTGTGRTHFLRLLAQYLSEKPDLLDFCGDVLFFEFLLGYCPPQEYFSEIPRFMAEVRRAAGFRGEYRGIVYIDIDEWQEHFTEKHFVSFLEFLADNSDDWLLIFSVSDAQPLRIRQMEAFLSAYLRLERITMEPPTVEALLQYAGQILQSCSIALQPDAEEILAGSITVLLRSPHFDGYKSVRMLCQDIAYTTLLEDSVRSGNLCAGDLLPFAADSAYIQKMLVNIEKTHSIGF